MATRSQRWLYWLLCWALILTLLPPGEPFRARGQSDDTPDTPADRHLYLPLVQGEPGTDEENVAENSFRFELDPEAETLVHQSSLEDAATNDEAASSDETLAATQPSATPRKLNTKSELAVATFRYEFQANRQTIFWVSFTNITRDALFLLPMTFQVNRLTFNVAASVEPTLSAVELGGDGILSPGETTAELRFDVTHRGKLFLYVVDAYAVVQPRSAPPAATACDLYPIALHGDTLASVAVGDTVNNILNGVGAGNFGWLTWTGDNSATALVASLIAPGNAQTYINPNNPADHKVSVGDWVRGRPGVANAVAVRNALNTLKTIDITLPVWGTTQGNGANRQYQITNFALVRLLDYGLPGQNRISVRFLGYNQRCGENQPPVGVPDSYATDEDQPLLVAAPGVLANDVDADALTALLVRPVLSGTMALQADGALVYTPTLNFHGVDSFTYVASDGAFNSDPVTVTITVRPLNDPPLAQADVATTDEDVTVTLAVLTNDRDADGDALIITAVTTPQQGSVTQNSDGTLLYTPAANRCGADEFSYTVADPSGATATATVAITVTCINDPPIAHDDTAETDAATPVTIAVLANDLDVDGDALAVAQVGAPGHGSATATADQRVTYTPAPGFSSTDHFTYTICDAGALCATAVVTVAVNQTNQPPVAVDDELTTPEETPLTIDVAANDRDPDGNLAPATATALATPLHGALTPLGHGRFSYTPTLDYHGLDRFPYQICDSAGLCALATVTLTITPVNDAPVALDDRYDAVEDTPLTIGAPGLLGNDRDVDRDPLTLVGDEQPGNGAVNVNLDSSFTYTPNPDFCGDDTFRYTISDGQAEATATVTLAVACVQDIPLTTLVESAPANGEGAVSLTRETVLIFSAPLAAATVSAATIGAYRDDQPLAAQVRLSPDRQRVILFYEQPLPAAAHIEVRLAGDDLRDDQGNAVDGDNDGQPGGAGVVAFDTLNLTRIPGTHVWGYVYDSYNKTPDGSDIPIAGATIRVDGLPEANAVTDETGYFILKDMPAPLFFVHIDGSTATSAPPGTIYATVGKAFHSVAAQTTQLVMDGATFHVYLPPMSQGDVRALSPTANTAIGFGAAGQAQLQKMFPNLDPAVWARTTVVFPSNAAIDAQGNPATQAAIIPVPADRLPAPLPPHMNHQLDIAVMAPGATNFDTPAPACFPNLPDPQTGQPLAPGAKSALISFNHDTGQWEVVGPMTVSADGLLICTDLGVGIRAPGWHGAQPSVPVSGGCTVNAPLPPPPSVSVKIIEPAVSTVRLQTGAKGYFRAEGTPAGGTYSWSSNSQPLGISSQASYLVQLGTTPYSDTIQVTYTYTHTVNLPCSGPQTQALSTTANVKVSVTNDGCGVTIFPSSQLTVGPGTTLNFKADATPADGKFSWAGGTAISATDKKIYTAQFPTTPGITAVSVIHTCFDSNGQITGTVADSVNVEVITNCYVAINGPDKIIAKPDEVLTFSASGNPAGGDYGWAGGIPQSATNQSQFQTKFTQRGATETVRVDYTCRDSQGNPIATVTDTVIVQVQDFVLTLTASSRSVWANGHKTVTITATLTDQANAPVQGRSISLSIRPPTGVTLLSGSVQNTNSNGNAIFTATSTQTGMVQFAATDTLDPSIKDLLNVEFMRHKVVFQFFGINTQLDCDFEGHCATSNPSDDGFQLLRSVLRHRGFSDADLLWYSYTGGFLDFSTGNWRAQRYNCNDTAQDYSISLTLLRNMLKDFGASNPNTDIILVGHSQGGLIAFQSLALADFISPTTRVVQVITLDSPLGGSPLGRSFIASIFSCWTGPANGQMVNLYNSVQDSYRHDQQGTYAKILCSLVGINGCQSITNNEYVQLAQQRGVSVFTYGGLDDGIYFPLICGPAGLVNATNNWSSQIVLGANVAFPQNMGGADTQLLFTDCIRSSHSAVYSVLAQKVASHIGNQHGFAGPLSPGNPPPQPVPSLGLHYFAMQNSNTGQVVQRGQAGTNGIAHSNLILAPNTEYVDKILQANTLSVGTVTFTTGEAGLPTKVPSIIIQPSISSDADNDTLPDDGELIIGTDPANPDSDGDGILDGPEVQQGSNPLDGKPARTGVIATADTPGNAGDLCALNDLAAVADGTAGVALFDITNADLPRLLSQVDTAGNAQRVACDGNWVAVADGEGGLAIVDMRNPRNATLHQQRSPAILGNNAVAVVAAGGIGYVGLSDGKVVSVDLGSGTVLERVTLTGVIRDLAIAGETLYALTADTLYTLPLNQAALAVAASVTSPGSNQRLFVGGGLAYATHTNGYNTFNLSNPNQPTLIARGQTGQVDWRQIVANGSGLGVAVVAVDPRNPPTINLYDVRDPSQTNRFLTQFTAAGQPGAVAIYNGLAYVAAGTAGLHVVNYLAYDIQKTPPTISLTTNFPPGTAEEGQIVRVTATVSDDVQVRSVEFFVDGVKVVTDGNFPFAQPIIAPRRNQQATFTLRAQAWDTGGNMSSTGDQVITLTGDTVAPRILRVSPRDGDTVANVGAVAAFFNEPIDPATLTADAFTLRAAGVDGLFDTVDDLLITNGVIEFRVDVLGAFMHVAGGLPQGRYRAQLAATVKDLVGNRLVAGQSWSFRVINVGNDRDADCLPDAVETTLGLNPDNPDSDNDGINDGEEDADNDGLSNCGEVLVGTDPANPDSDGDGIRDGAEDSDGDDLSNADELLAGTDFLDPDSDDDRYPDGLEVAARSDPLDPASTPYTVTGGEAVSPVIAILNLTSPADPSLPNEAVGVTIAVLNTITPTSSGLPNEAVGTTIAILNTTNPADPTLPNEAVSPPFSVENQGNP